MTHEKIEQNIYYDERCTKNPYYVNIMRCGQVLYKKFTSLEECREAKETFIKRFTLQETEHPLLFLKDGTLVMEVTIVKEFDDWDEAVKKADIIQKFIGI